jgi:hypothetical protein
MASRRADWAAFVKGDSRIRRIFQRDSTGKVNGFVERREMWDIIWVKST